MKRIFLCFGLFFMLYLPVNVSGSEIIGPEIRLISNEVVVTTGLQLDTKILNELKNGISKEITFYIDLFKVWNIWPDEFISGRKFVRTLKSDPIKKEHIATSFDGVTLTERRFKSLDSMIAWSLNIRDLKLTLAKDPETADYLIRVTAEAKLMELPPVIGHLLFFVPEKDFKLSKSSPAFRVKGLR